MADDKKARGWDVHAREQLQAWRGLTHQQRLDWLWQAKLFAERAQKAAARRRLEKSKP